jgi:hypothetical protein
MEPTKFSRKTERLKFLLTWMLGGILISLVLAWLSRGMRWLWHHFFNE